MRYAFVFEIQLDMKPESCPLGGSYGGEPLRAEGQFSTTNVRGLQLQPVSKHHGRVEGEPVSIS
jgi:hypothetical protein